MARMMGLDVGDKRIGVALSDPQSILASPFTIIERTGDEETITAIIDIVNHQEVEWIIAGLPHSLSGNVGEQAEKVEDFVDKLREAVNIPVEFRDERLTTVVANRLMRSVSGRKGKKRELQDARAAAIILQGYLDEDKNVSL